jgi:hypothetical protein
MKNEQSLDEIVKKVFPTQKGLNTVDTDRIMLRRNIWLKGAKYVKERSYSEEDMINFAFDTYYYISKLMEVPFNQISENKLHAIENLKQFKKK